MWAYYTCNIIANSNCIYQKGGDPEDLLCDASVVLFLGAAAYLQPRGNGWISSSGRPALSKDAPSTQCRWCHAKIASLHETVTELGMSFSDGLLHPKSTKEPYLGLFLPAAVGLYNQCSQQTQ
ncbi:hypothetical protein AMECASPLE_022016 [Ameca splendens]|uniref:Uncharacterized protein n=1 Tax=Ameca splendens TaxID=208324 RepID=A0ABV0YRE9_9TELE